MAAFAATMATSWSPSHTTARVVSSRVASCGVNSVSSVSVAMRSSLRRNSFAAVRASSDAGTGFINIICSKIRRHSSFCVVAQVGFRSRSACGGKDLSRGASFEKAETMKMAAVLCRNIRRLSTMSSQGSSGLVAKPMAGRKDASSPIWNVESRGTGGARVQLGAMSRVGVVRFMGFGTFNEEHKNAEVPHDESEVCVSSSFAGHDMAFLVHEKLVAVMDSCSSDVGLGPRSSYRASALFLSKFLSFLEPTLAIFLC